MWRNICLYIMVNVGLESRSKLSIHLDFMHTLYINPEGNFKQYFDYDLLYEVRSRVFHI